MQIPDEIRLGIELLGLFASAGAILYRVGRMSERLTEISKTVDKLENTLEAVAVQKSEIAAIRETMALNTKRTDETFIRVFNILDRVKGP